MSQAAAAAPAMRRPVGKWINARWISVRRTEMGFRWGLAQELKKYAITSLPRGKGRRSWKHKAVDLVNCCRGIRARQCSACGQMDCNHASVIASCELRTCPGCARRRADVFRARLDRAMEKGTHGEHSLYMLTFTLRYDPASVLTGEIDDLRARKERLLDAWRHVWRFDLSAGTRVHGEFLGGAACALEVSHRGAVHAHVLYLGRRIDYKAIDAAYKARLGSSGDGYVNFQRVKGNPRGAINEMTKYLLKSTSPKRSLQGKVGDYPDPKLAARVEVAFANARLFQCYGGWRGLSDEGDEDVIEPAACDGCGAVGEWTKVVMDREEWLVIAGAAWLPTFQRAGPPPSIAAQRAREKLERSCLED